MSCPWTCSACCLLQWWTSDSEITEDDEVFGGFSPTNTSQTRPTEDQNKFTFFEDNSDQVPEFSSEEGENCWFNIFIKCSMDLVMRIARGTRQWWEVPKTYLIMMKQKVLL